MALSDHDQTVLSEMEAAFRADSVRFTTARSAAKDGAGVYLAAAIGLLIAGVVATAVGLWLANDLGTVLGVLGFPLIVGSCWSATHLLDPQRGWTTHTKRQPKRK